MRYFCFTALFSQVHSPDLARIMSCFAPSVGNSLRRRGTHSAGCRRSTDRCGQSRLLGCRDRGVDASAAKDVRGRWWCRRLVVGAWPRKRWHTSGCVGKLVWKHETQAIDVLPAALFALVVMLAPCLVTLLSGDAMTLPAMRRTCSGLWPSLYSEARGKATLPQLGWTWAVPDDMCLSCTPVETYPRLTTPH
jgi:hypothetical protein